MWLNKTHLYIPHSLSHTQRHQKLLKATQSLGISPIKCLEIISTARSIQTPTFPNGKAKQLKPKIKMLETEAPKKALATK